jgi:hypothetical protein
MASDPFNRKSDMRKLIFGFLFAALIGVIVWNWATALVR